jgi:hypothetical protein
LGRKRCVGVDRAQWGLPAPMMSYVKSGSLCLAFGIGHFHRLAPQFGVAD